MAAELGHKSEITLTDILPLLFKYADLAEDMPRIRRISKVCASIVDEACLRFKLKFGSADDCIAGTKYFQQVLAKNKNIQWLAVDIQDRGYLQSIFRSGLPPEPSPEELAFQNAAYALPLQSFFAASPTQWPNLKELELYTLKTAASSFGEFTPSHFPNLERLTLSCYSFLEDFQLELPTLSYFKLFGCPLTSKGLTEILCNQSLTSLTSLYLADLECNDWSAFQDIELRSLKHLRIDMEDYSNDFLVYLHRGAGKALQNLEGLHIHCCDVPLTVFLPNFPEPQDLKPIDRLFVNNTDFKNLRYLTLEFKWDCESPAAFIKIARACPNLKKLSLDDWFEEPRDTGDADVDDDILYFREGLSRYYEVFAEENAREPLLPHIQEMCFRNVWEDDTLVQGMSEVVCYQLIKRIWPHVLFCGNGYKCL